MHGQYGVGMVNACSGLRKGAQLLSQPRGADTSELQWNYAKGIAWLLHDCGRENGNDGAILARVSTL